MAAAVAATAAKAFASEFQNYMFSNARKLYCIEDWPIYADWLHVCKTGDMSTIQAFHSKHLANMQLECIDMYRKDAKTHRLYYDTTLKILFDLPYDPYKEFMTRSAREIIYNDGSAEAILWFSKQNPKVVDPLQVVYGVNSLFIMRKLKEARIVLALFPNLPFEAAANDVGNCIFRSVLMTGDIPLIHDVWLLGALKNESARAYADAACLKKGWVTPEAIQWYNEHRDKEPKQHITGRYEYLT